MTTLLINEYYITKSSELNQWLWLLQWNLIQRRHIQFKLKSLDGRIQTRVFFIIFRISFQVNLTEKTFV